MTEPGTSCTKPALDRRGHKAWKECVLCINDIPLRKRCRKLFRLECALLVIYDIFTEHNVISFLRCAVEGENVLRTDKGFFRNQGGSRCAVRMAGVRRLVGGEIPEGEEFVLA